MVGRDLSTGIVLKILSFSFQINDVLLDKAFIKNEANVKCQNTLLV